MLPRKASDKGRLAGKTENVRRNTSSTPRQAGTSSRLGTVAANWKSKWYGSNTAEQRKEDLNRKKPMCERVKNIVCKNLQRGESKRKAQNEDTKEMEKKPMMQGEAIRKLTSIIRSRNAGTDIPDEDLKEILDLIKTKSSEDATFLRDFGENGQDVRKFLMQHVKPTKHACATATGNHRNDRSTERTSLESIADAIHTKERSKSTMKSNEGSNSQINTWEDLLNYTKRTMREAENGIGSSRPIKEAHSKNKCNMFGMNILVPKGCTIKVNVKNEDRDQQEASHRIRASSSCGINSPDATWKTASVMPRRPSTAEKVSGSRVSGDSCHGTGIKDSKKIGKVNSMRIQSHKTKHNNTLPEDSRAESQLVSRNSDKGVNKQASHSNYTRRFNRRADQVIKEQDGLKTPIKKYIQKEISKVQNQYNTLVTDTIDKSTQCQTSESGNLVSNTQHCADSQREHILSQYAAYTTKPKEKKKQIRATTKQSKAKSIITSNGNALSSESELGCSPRTERCSDQEDETRNKVKSISFKSVSSSKYLRERNAITTTTNSKTTHLKQIISCSQRNLKLNVTKMNSQKYFSTGKERSQTSGGSTNNLSKQSIHSQTTGCRYAHGTRSQQRWEGTNQSEEKSVSMFEKSHAMSTNKLPSMESRKNMVKDSATCNTCSPEKSENGSTSDTHTSSTGMESHNVDNCTSITPPVAHEIVDNDKNRFIPEEMVLAKETIDLENNKTFFSKDDFVKRSECSSSEINSAQETPSHVHSPCITWWDKQTEGPTMCYIAASVMMTIRSRKRKFSERNSFSLPESVTTETAQRNQAMRQYSSILTEKKFLTSKIFTNPLSKKVCLEKPKSEHTVEFVLDYNQGRNKNDTSLKETYRSESFTSVGSGNHDITVTPSELLRRVSPSRIAHSRSNNTISTKNSPVEVNKGKFQSDVFFSHGVSMEVKQLQGVTGGPTTYQAGAEVTIGLRDVEKSYELSCFSLPVTLNDVRANSLNRREQALRQERHYANSDISTIPLTNSCQDVDIEDLTENFESLSDFMKPENINSTYSHQNETPKLASAPGSDSESVTEKYETPQGSEHTTVNDYEPINELEADCEVCEVYEYEETSYDKIPEPPVYNQEYLYIMHQTLENKTITCESHSSIAVKESGSHLNTEKSHSKLKEIPENGINLSRLETQSKGSMAKQNTEDNQMTTIQMNCFEDLDKNELPLDNIDNTLQVCKQKSCVMQAGDKISNTQVAKEFNCMLFEASEVEIIETKENDFTLIAEECSKEYNGSDHKSRAIRSSGLMTVQGIRHLNSDSYIALQRKSPDSGKLPICLSPYYRLQGMRLKQHSLTYISTYKGINSRVRRANKEEDGGNPLKNEISFRELQQISAQSSCIRLASKDSIILQSPEEVGSDLTDGHLKDSRVQNTGESIYNSDANYPEQNVARRTLSTENLDVTIHDSFNTTDTIDNKILSGFLNQRAQIVLPNNMTNLESNDNINRIQDETLQCVKMDLETILVKSDLSLQENPCRLCKNYDYFQSPQSINFYDFWQLCVRNMDEIVCRNLTSLSSLQNEHCAKDSSLQKEIEDMIYGMSISDMVNNHARLQGKNVFSEEKETDNGNDCEDMNDRKPTNIKSAESSKVDGKEVSLPWKSYSSQETIKDNVDEKTRCTSESSGSDRDVQMESASVIGKSGILNPTSACNLTENDHCGKYISVRWSPSSICCLRGEISKLQHLLSNDSTYLRKISDDHKLGEGTQGKTLRSKECRDEIKDSIICSSAQINHIVGRQNEINSRNETEQTTASDSINITPTTFERNKSLASSSEIDVIEKANFTPAVTVYDTFEISSSSKVGNAVNSHKDKQPESIKDIISKSSDGCTSEKNLSLTRDKKLAFKMDTVSGEVYYTNADPASDLLTFHVENSNFKSDKSPESPEAKTSVSNATVTIHNRLRCILRDIVQDNRKLVHKIQGISNIHNRKIISNPKCFNGKLNVASDTKFSLSHISSATETAQHAKQSCEKLTPTLGGRDGIDEDIGQVGLSNPKGCSARIPSLHSHQEQILKANKNMKSSKSWKHIMRDSYTDDGQYLNVSSTSSTSILGRISVPRTKGNFEDTQDKPKAEDKGKQIRNNGGKYDSTVVVQIKQSNNTGDMVNIQVTEYLKKAQEARASTHKKHSKSSHDKNEKTKRNDPRIKKLSQTCRRHCTHNKYLLDSDSMNRVEYMRNHSRLHNRSSDDEEILQRSDVRSPLTSNVRSKRRIVAQMCPTCSSNVIGVCKEKSMCWCTSAFRKDRTSGEQLQEDASDMSLFKCYGSDNVIAACSNAYCPTKDQEICSRLHTETAAYNPQTNSVTRSNFQAPGFSCMNTAKLPLHKRISHSHNLIPLEFNSTKASHEKRKHLGCSSGVTKDQLRSPDDKARVLWALVKAKASSSGCQNFRLLKVVENVAVEKDILAQLDTSVSSSGDSEQTEQ